MNVGLQLWLTSLTTQQMHKYVLLFFYSRTCMKHVKNDQFKKKKQLQSFSHRIFKIDKKCVLLCIKTHTLQTITRLKRLFKKKYLDYLRLKKFLFHCVQRRIHWYDTKVRIFIIILYSNSLSYNNLPNKNHIISNG